MEAAIQPSAKGCSHLHRKLGKRFVKPTTRYWLFEVGQLDAWFDRKSPDMIFVTSSTGSASVKTSQELRMLSSVTINCHVTKIVMNSGSQLSVLIVISVSNVTSLQDCLFNCQNGKKKQLSELSKLSKIV